MTDTPIERLQKILLRHHSLTENSRGREHVPGVREGLAQVDDELRTAMAAAQEAVNGNLEGPAHDELRAALDMARIRLGDDAPAEPDRPQIFLNHTGQPTDPRDYARRQLTRPRFDALLVRPEDTRKLYALKDTDDYRIQIGEAKDVRNPKTMADRLWDHDTVPKYTTKTWPYVLEALLLVKQEEVGITADEITRGWLAAYARGRLAEHTYDLDDDGDRTAVAGAGSPTDDLPGICWVAGAKLGDGRRLLLHSEDLETFVAQGLKQQIGRGASVGRLRAPLHAVQGAAAARRRPRRQAQRTALLARPRRLRAGGRRVTAWSQRGQKPLSRASGASKTTARIAIEGPNAGSAAPRPSKPGTEPNRGATADHSAGSTLAPLAPRRGRWAPHHDPRQTEPTETGSAPRGSPTAAYTPLRAGSPHPRRRLARAWGAVL